MLRKPNLPIIISFLIATVFSQALAPDNSRADQLLDITVAIPRHFPPYYTVNKNGDPEGFAIEVMECLAEISGSKLTETGTVSAQPEIFDRGSHRKPDARHDGTVAIGCFCR